MKILQFVCDGSPGGGTNHVLQLLESPARGTTCQLLTQRDSYLADQARKAGIEVFEGDFFRSRLDPKSASRISEVCRQVQPDLLHCHGGRAAFFASFANTETPSVYTVHGFHHDRKSIVPRAAGWGAELRSLRSADHVLFVSDFDRKLALRQRLLPSSKNHTVIHNGIKPLRQRTNQQRLGVGFLGRLVFQKNPQLFLDIADQVQGVNFVVAGGGPLEETISDQVKKRGLTERVTLLGTLDHTAALEYLSKLDVLVMTPRWEGLPLLLLEAMFLGVPVVSTAVGGIPEVVEHGKTGLLSQSQDPKSMASHVKTLLADKPLRERMVTAASQHAHENFSQQRMLDRTWSVYSDVLAKANSMSLEHAF